MAMTGDIGSGSLGRLRVVLMFAIRKRMVGIYEHVASSNM
jgi:hypothetical protein